MTRGSSSAPPKGQLIDKTRHLVEYGGMTWEIDEFHGENSGLVVAELELDRRPSVPAPDWLGVEVTQLARYYNVRLVKYPIAHGPTPSGTLACASRGLADAAR